ncbi:histone H1-delta-like [Liolophura sinensis]|uniref:histone H1-delta-like n=1 Tax=Liolophura sinensis TaxID=3198878 RepID=UPI0031582C01
MADSAPAPAMQKAKKTTKPKKPTDHPKYIEMVVAALKELKERGGCSKSKILKYIMVNYKVSDERTVNTHLKVALRNGVKTGVLKQTKGTGASGSFRLGDAAKKAPAKPKKVVKKSAAKKPATKKTTATKKTKSPKKVAKKPAVKKTPTKKVVKKPKSPKKVAKKPASKKPSKSPKKVAKKPAKKTAAKKTKA